MAIDNFIRIVLLDNKKDIEQENRTSDNRAFHIRNEKMELINYFVASKRIAESDRKEAYRIVGIKN